jgi:hypothetical protein
MNQLQQPGIDCFSVEGACFRVFNFFLLIPQTTVKGGKL